MTDAREAGRRSDIVPPVVVVVVLYNSAELLPGLVESLEAGLGHVPWRLVAVDNASPDAGAEVMQALLPECTVVRAERNGGYAAGINAGVSAAGPYRALLLLNPDVRLGTGCVPRLLEALAEPGVGIAVPRLLDASGRRIDSQRREPTVLRTAADALLGAVRVGRYRLLGEVVTDRASYLTDRDVDWAEGSTQLVSAACWAACGPWDESFFLYSEETDFALRAGDAGFVTRYVAEAEATHLEGGSGSSPALWALLVVNRVRLYRRRRGLLAAIPFWAFTLLRETLRAALGRARHQAAVRALLSPRKLSTSPGPAWLAGMSGREVSVSPDLRSRR